MPRKPKTDYDKGAVGVNPMTKQPFTTLDSFAWDDVAEYWKKCQAGGWLICSGSGKAVNLRYRMYKYRKLLQQRDGATAYDELIIRIEDNKLQIMRREREVVEIIPDAENEYVGKDAIAVPTIKDLDLN